MEMDESGGVDRPPGGAETEVGRRQTLAHAGLAASLLYPAGAILLAATVLLAGDAAPVLAGEDIGSATIVVEKVTGALDGDVRRLARGERVRRNEVIETADSSASEIVFLDDTKVALGPNARLILDRFVFDPDPALGKFAMTTDKGVFRFQSGKLAKGSYVIRTPAVTIAVGGAAGSDAAKVARPEDCKLVSTTVFADGTMLPPGAPPEWAVAAVRELDEKLGYSAEEAGDARPCHGP
ncbi:MAG: FecR domain-containing protein [Proteobacteria bacterium]|nr:FecR domain-containing protein [Pseudomonadota bacterium]